MPPLGPEGYTAALPSSAASRLGESGDETGIPDAGIQQRVDQPGRNNAAGQRHGDGSRQRPSPFTNTARRR